MEEVQHRQKTWLTLHHLNEKHKGYNNNYNVYKQTGLKT